MGYDSSVLSKASAETFGVTAKNWSESAHRFLKRCSDAGNVEACYTLGMVGHFSCFVLILIYKQFVILISFVILKHRFDSTVFKTGKMEHLLWRRRR